MLVSAGYMRILGPAVLRRSRALAERPPGAPAVVPRHARRSRDALAYGVKVTGVTVHLVDEGVDTGPIVVQEAVEVRDDDDWDSLEARDPRGRAPAAPRGRPRACSRAG